MCIHQAHQFDGEKFQFNLFAPLSAAILQVCAHIRYKTAPTKDFLNVDLIDLIATSRYVKSWVNCSAAAVPV